MAASKTSLSAGSILYGMLTANEDVMAKVTAIFPVVTDEAILPYILYRRSALKHDPIKAPNPGADTVTMEIICYTENYSDSVELAEAVRAALDGKQGKQDELVMRSCKIVDASEDYGDDAYAQVLSFEIKI